MDRLLLQVQAFCQGTFSWVRQADVALVPDPGVIPEWVGLPYIGLKDGSVTHHHDLIGNVQEDEMIVDIYIYDRLGRGDENIIGLHEKARDVSGKVKGYLFTAGILSAVPLSQMPVALLMTQKKGLVIRKGLRFKYEREE